MQRKKFKQTPPYSALVSFDFSLFSSGCGFFSNLLRGIAEGTTIVTGAPLAPMVPTYAVVIVSLLM